MKTAHLLTIVLVIFATGCRYGDSTSADDRDMTADRLAAQAAQAMVDDRVADARDLLLKATDLRPDFAEAWVGLGMALTRLESEQEASAAYQRALDIHHQRYADTKSAYDLQQEIFILLLLKRSDEAAAALEQGKTVHADDESFMLFADGYPELTEAIRTSQIKIN